MLVIFPVVQKTDVWILQKWFYVYVYIRKIATFQIWKAAYVISDMAFFKAGDCLIHSGSFINAYYTQLCPLSTNNFLSCQKQSKRLQISHKKCNLGFTGSHNLKENSKEEKIKAYKNKKAWAY